MPENELLNMDNDVDPRTGLYPGEPDEPTVIDNAVNELHRVAKIIEKNAHVMVAYADEVSDIGSRLKKAARTARKPF